MTSATFTIFRDMGDDGANYDVTVQGTVTEDGVEDFTVQVITDEDGEMHGFALTDEERAEAEKALVEADADAFSLAYSAHCDHLADCARDGDL